MLKLTVRYDTESELLAFLRVFRRKQIVKIYPKLSKAAKFQAGNYFSRRDVYIDLTKG